MQNPTLEQILNRTEVLDFSKSYKYAKQEGILGKPSLFITNESLKSYPLKIKLHHSFCNPQKVIDEIELKAKNRQVINWFQHGKYVGDYFIEKYSVKVNQKINGTVIYAEIQLNLIENPDKNSSFQQQAKIISKINAQKYQNNSTVIKNFSKNPSVYNSVISKLETKTNLNLSPSAGQIYKQIKAIILQRIKEEGLSNAKIIINEICTKLSTENALSNEDFTIIKTDLETIPETLYNAAIRSIQRK